MTIKLYIVEFIRGDSYENRQWVSDTVFKSVDRCEAYLENNNFKKSGHEHFMQVIDDDHWSLDPTYATIKELILVED